MLPDSLARSHQRRNTGRSASPRPPPRPSPLPCRQTEGHPCTSPLTHSAVRHHGGCDQVARFQPDGAPGALHDTQGVRVWNVC